MLPKLQNWLTKSPDSFPRRLLLSGSERAVDEAIKIAAHLQEISEEKVLSGIHTDTIVFRDEGKSFKIDYSDAAQRDGQNKYENARGLIKWMHRTPNEGKYRIVILEGLERLSREAPHALLKLIEEPPKDAFLIFTTKNHHQILETILSRVTLIRLPKRTLGCHPERSEVKRNEVEGSFAQQAEEFISSTNRIFRFRMIEDLDKEAKKKKDRNVLPNFTSQILQLARTKKDLQKSLPLVFETLQALKRNQNQRFCLERLAIKL